MHDLIRSYARDLAATDPASSRQQALDRLLDYYQHTAALADKLLARHARTRPAPAPQAIPAAVPDLTGRTQALAWARAERATLLACLDQATTAGQHARVIALTAATASLLRQDGPWTSAITRHAAAIQAARHLGNRLTQANALNDLGDVRLLTGDYRGAAEALEEALDISRDITYRHGEAEILNETGALYRVRGDPTRAAEYHRQAQTLSREVASPRDEACALAGLGRCALALGRTSDAAEHLRQARDIFQQIGAAEAADVAVELGTLAGPR